MRAQTTRNDKLGKQDQQVGTDIDSGSTLSIGDIFKMLGRHKYFILVCTLVCTGISLAYIRASTPIYEASASIRIDPSRASSLGLADLTGAGALAEDKVATEMAIIKSDAVAIDTLNSLSDDEYKSYVGTTKDKMGIPQGATSLSVSQENLLGRFKHQINAVAIPSTELVSITCRDPNPKTAALLVNHVIASYLKQSFDSRYGSVVQVTSWLSAEMDSLRLKASEAQRKLADFQEQNNILGTDSGSSSNTSGVGPGNTTMDRLGLLNTRLATAQSDRIVKEAQMRAAANSDPAVLSALFPSANLSALEAEQSRIHSLYTQLATKFGPNYPPLAEAKADQDKIDAAFNAEVVTIRKRLREEYDSAKTIEDALQKEYDDQTEKAYSLNREQAQYAVLKAEGNSSRDLFNTLQYKLQQAGVDAGLGGVDTILVDTARAPLAPIEPKKTAIMSFGLVLGLFTGIGISLLREATSDRIQNPEQPERTLGLPLLAVIPHFSPAALRDPDKPTWAQAHMLPTYTSPLSREAESFRTLRNSILLSLMDTPAKTILVTSTIPGEGKSNTAANFAVVLAQKNARVLLVDADLRRPTMHQRYNANNDKGLGDLILGDPPSSHFQHPLADLDNLVFLAAGQKVALPSEALGSTRFYSMLQQWEKEFDYIIIDSAPLLVVSDSLPLASWADTLILVTRFNMTPLSALKRIRDVLQRTNAHVAGFVINDVSANGTSYGSYGYGKNYGYYN